jgi:hypothetical protein
MKHLIYGAVMLLALVLTSCNNDDPSVAVPQVTAQLLESGKDFVKLSVETKDAERGAYLCLPTTERQPSPSTILNTGKAMNVVNGKEEIIIDNLKQNTAYVVYVASCKATEVATTTLQVTTAKAYSYEVEMTDGWITYYGDFYQNHTGYFMVAMSSGPISKSGLPTRVDDKALHLFIGDAISSNSNNAMITPGVYRISDAHERGTVDSYNSRFIIATEIANGEASQGYTFKFVDGTVTVDHDASGAYTITADMRIERSGIEENIKCSYKGKLAFTNQDPAQYNPLMKDVNMIPKGMSGNYSKDSKGNYGIYNFAIYNTPVDAGGFINGAGELVCFTLISPYTDKMDLDKLVGTYDNVIVSAPDVTFTPFSMIAGMYESFYGTYVPQGSFYCHYDDALQMDVLGLFVKGKVVITKEGDNIRLKGDMLTVQDKRVVVEATAPASAFYDYSTYAKPFRQVQHKSGNLLRALPAVK